MIKTVVLEKAHFMWSKHIFLFYQEFEMKLTPSQNLKSLCHTYAFYFDKPLKAYN